MTTALQVVSEPRRQEILRLIWDGERRAGDIAARLDVSFSAVSQHLAKLRAAGVVTARVSGRERYYRADRTAMGPLAAYLEHVWSQRLATLKQLAEEEEESHA